MSHRPPEEETSIENTKYCFYDEHETQVVHFGEANLQQHFNACKKNPGHKQFIPVLTFAFDHLPEDFRDHDLYNVIKAISQLTVRVSVNHSSNERPKYWPYTKEPTPYPFYYKTGSPQFLRTGSGRVRHVVKQASPCSCGKCQQSDRPSQEFWVIYVETARHVVYNNDEAAQTTLRFFYLDSTDERAVCLDQLIVEDANTERDMSVLKCVSCDRDLGLELHRSWLSFHTLWNIVHEKYKATRDQDRLVFIVSHPHGCVQHVTFGRWIEKKHFPSNSNYCSFSYTTSTCPGSSGATVFNLGYTWWWQDQLVHSGAELSGPNLSNYAYNI